MALAALKQNFQDWITQQWVILFGQKIDKINHNWLLGPFGSTKGIGVAFIDQLAKHEQIIVDTKSAHKGLLQSIQQLNLTAEEQVRLSRHVIDFYEHTANYHLALRVVWNPVFKLFGILLHIIFSRRIEQLNIPVKNLGSNEALTNNVIQLYDVKSKEIKRTIWLRTFENTGEVVYSGVYETCKLPKGKTCIKAMFPLPNGNATVILTPKVGANGELILDSSGQRVGDSGFYFVLKDAKGQLWAKFIKSFKDKLVVSDKNNIITAKQTLKLWGITVVRFNYAITKN